MSTHCKRCGKRLHAETTGFYPFADGYICSVCRDITGEEFCRAMDEYNASDIVDAIPSDKLLTFLAGFSH